MQSLIIPRIIYGRGCSKYLKKLKGDSILIVTDENVQKLEFFNKKILKFLGKTGMKIEIFNEVEPDPKDKTVYKGVELAKRVSPDWFIAVGGGSSIDAAKAIQFSYETGIDFKNLELLKKYDYKSKLIAIPTTSGTGSEASFAFVITDTSAANRKLGRMNYALTPDIAILDPQFPLKMPKNLTLATALDALSHSIESFISSLSNEISNALSFRAMFIIFNNLPKVMENLEDQEAREKIHLAALMGGISMAGSGIGLAHGIAHSVGAVFKIPHGSIVGLALPYVLEFSRVKIRAKVEEILLLLSIKYEKNPVLTFANYLRNFFRELGAPLSLKDLKITKTELQEQKALLVDLTDRDITTGVNPRKPSVEEIEKIYDYMLEGKDIDF